MKRFLIKNADAIIDSLPGIISGGISAKDLSVVTGSDPSTSERILDGLLAVGIGQRRDGLYFFEDGDRLKTAIELLKNGGQFDRISEVLGWKDFEGLVAEILFDMSFAVMRNLILTKPRMEIDVVGVRLGVAMLVDCKHWKRYSRSALTTAVDKQIARTRHYVAQTSGSVAVPVIVTLYQDEMDFIDRVPIVPISKFSSFVDDLYGCLDDVRTIEA